MFDYSNQFMAETTEASKLFSILDISETTFRYCALWNSKNAEKKNIVQFQKNTAGAYLS